MIRLSNCIAVSDDGFLFDRARWRFVLETMRIDDKPILALEDPEQRKTFDDLLGYIDLEYRPTILERTRKEGVVITDDNMVVEWREPLRYPDLKAPR